MDYKFDSDWRNLRVGVFDTETTGLNPEKDRLTEFGLIVFEGGAPVENFCCLINPGQAIGEKASSVSGITDKMVSGKKRFSKIGKTIKRKLRECDVWCAFNESFDRSFLNAEFRRNGMIAPKRPILDPRIFCDFFWPEGPNNLDAVTQRLRISPTSQMLKFVKSKDRHRADYDALLTGIALYLLESRLPKTLRRVLYVQHWMLEQFIRNKYGAGYTGKGRRVFPLLPEDFEKNAKSNQKNA